MTRRRRGTLAAQVEMEDLIDIVAALPGAARTDGATDATYVEMEDPARLQDIVLPMKDEDEPPEGQGKRSRAKLPPGTPPNTRKWSLRP